MSTQQDRLQIPGSPERPYYATGILLDARDFTEEQFYHRGRLARALAYLHGSGTAAGLRVRWEEPLEPGADPDFPDGREERVLVEPGLAIDRLGRMIELPRAACIRLGRWYQAQSPDALIQGLHGEPHNGVVVDVFIRFAVCEHEKTPAFVAGPVDALDAVVPSRVRDWYQLDLVIRGEAEPPLPTDPWPDLASMPEDEVRRDAVRDAIFDAWREGTEWWDQNGPVPLGEHAVGQDPVALFLARLVLPATAAESVEARPVRTQGAPVTVDNQRRRFVYTANLLARWLGI